MTQHVVGGRVGKTTVKGIGKVPVRVSLECPSGEHQLGRICTCSVSEREVSRDDRDAGGAVPDR